MYLNLGLFLQVIGVSIVLSIVLGLGKSTILKRLYLIMSILMVIVGIVGSILVRDTLVRLMNQSRDRFYEADQFIQWATAKFDTYAIWSLSLTAIIILALVVIMVMNRSRLTSDFQIRITITLVVLMVIYFIAAIVYGFGTINKELDLASYILTLTACEIMMLYIPLIVKRLLIRIPQPLK
ncbi:hypothetical protein E0485_08725 [Paenibacillus albiflavus]|uniref:Uncharacterized protein n=1 Tax=Paenibacillus albiflavus TaxID=2545760 RepID=A0A4R4EGC6_9BACL|nr:hypothetical protein [Paenibacillus albiflavus]TCZ78200.1 hypothetical protein E0485_08725 [Paenibacillus albiflavus]